MTCDVVVIGAGIVGIACGRECASQGLSTVIIERHDSFGQETSSHNSEVIHSGIYYPTGSLKARFCVEGNRMMYEDCERLGVFTRQCGKLIVAVGPDELPTLEVLYARGLANGVDRIQYLEAPDVRKLEPAITCTAAILLETTGIVDSHGLMRAYLREARDRGAEIAFGTEFMAVEHKEEWFDLVVREHDGSITRLKTRRVINAAGLACDRVAAAFGIDPDEAGYRLHPNRGHYFAVNPAKARLVSRLVYPTPSPHLVGTGIHMTIDRAGQLKLGPDTEYVNPDQPQDAWYTFDETRKQKFYDAVVRYFPALTPDDLSPDQIGVRAKIKGSDTAVKDFIIQSESARGLDGLVNLIGIESPGLTCAAMIAREAVRILMEN